MSVPKENNLVHLLSIIKDMDPFPMAAHSADEVNALEKAADLFQLTKDDVYYLAWYYFHNADDGTAPPDNWISERRTHIILDELEHYGYLKVMSGYSFHLTVTARRHIEQGSPFIVTDSTEEDKRVFAVLDGDIDRFFDDDCGFSARDLAETIRDYPRSVFANRFVERFGTRSDEEIAFVLVLASHFQKSGPVAWRIPGDVPIHKRNPIFSMENKLLGEGVLITTAEDLDIDGRKNLGLPVLLSPDNCSYLFRGLGDLVGFATCFSRCGHIIRSADIAKKELYYDDATENEMKLIHKAISKEKYRKIMEALKAHSRRKTLACLLYGPPGTGKTELALQLAKETGRDIIQADIDKMTGSYVGESERNYRSLFLSYRYAVKVLDHVPILLLNEADAFLSSRVQITRANEKYENNLQAILLEEFENFEGILIATTNHTDNLDEAFDRRFFAKVEIGIPASETRLRIWRNALPTIPINQLALLADRFALTGAQIDNVVTRLDILTALDERTPSFSEIMDLCYSEERKITGRQRGKIGYNINENKH